MSPVVTINISWGLMKLETGRASYFGKHCSSSRRGKVYWWYNHEL